MSEQQDPSVREKGADEAATDTSETTFEQSAAEMEMESEVAENSAEGLSQLLEQARAKADEHYEQMMRAHAELENLKRRHERDLENAHKSGTAWNWVTAPRRTRRPMCRSCAREPS